MDDIDFSSIIVNGYNYAYLRKDGDNLLISYFKREAKKAEDKYYENSEFFDNCKNCINYFKQNIKSQYYKERNEETQAITFYEKGQMRNQSGEKCTDEEIAEGIKRHKEQRDWLNEYEYKTYFKENSNIRLKLGDLEWIENIILKIELEKNIVESAHEVIKKKTDTDTPQITIPSNILTELENQSFIENATARPLKWTALNSRTSKPDNPQPNKKALIDLLCLLGYSDEIVTNVSLINKNFTFSNGKPFAANNKTDITDKNGKLERPIISEYHDQLSDIISKSK